MGKELKLELTSGKVYFPGQAIAGIVSMSLDKPRECENVKVEFMGTGTVGWSEMHRGFTTFFPAQEEYLNSVLVLKQPKEGSDKVSLPIGTSSFPFKFILPNSLPASFNCEYGRVTYTITASVGRPWYSGDIEVTEVISVVGWLDLNSPLPSYLGLGGRPTDSFSLQKSTNIYCLCCSSGPAELKVCLPRTGFVPGELLPFSVEITNGTRANFKSCSCTFNQKCTMVAKGSCRVVENVVRKVESPYLLSPGENQVWKNDSLVVPPLPPTKLGGSNIIHVKYFLKFEVTFRGIMGDSLIVEVPITIGTVPFRSVFKELFESASVQSNADPNPEGNTPIVGGELSEESIQKFKLFDNYPDFPKHRFARSAVHWSKVFDDADDPYGPDLSEDNDSSDPKKYRPYCIYFEKRII